MIGRSLRKDPGYLAEGGRGVRSGKGPCPEKSRRHAPRMPRMIPWAALRQGPEGSFGRVVRTPGPKPCVRRRVGVRGLLSALPVGVTVFRECSWVVFGWGCFGYRLRGMCPPSTGKVGKINAGYRGGIAFHKRREHSPPRAGSSPSGGARSRNRRCGGSAAPSSS